MGYSGLGMQRWIYTQKTRKMFQKRSKPDSGGNASDPDLVNKLLNSKAKYRKFIDHKQFTPEYKVLLLAHLKTEQKAARRKYIIFILLTLLFIAPVAYYFYELNKKIETSKVRQVTKELFTPQGKIKTALFMDAENQILFSMEQYINDSLVYKQNFQ